MGRKEFELFAQLLKDNHNRFKNSGEFINFVAEFAKVCVAINPRFNMGLFFANVYDIHKKLLK